MPNPSVTRPLIVCVQRLGNLAQTPAFHVEPKQPAHDADSWMFILFRPLTPLSSVSFFPVADGRAPHAAGDRSHNGPALSHHLLGVGAAVRHHAYPFPLLGDSGSRGPPASRGPLCTPSTRCPPLRPRRANRPPSPQRANRPSASPTTSPQAKCRQVLPPIANNLRGRYHPKRPPRVTARLVVVPRTRLQSPAVPFF